MTNAIAYDRRAAIGGAVLIAGAVAAQAYTGVWLWLAVPFAVLYCGALLLNWKTAWWVMLACIPPSVQLFFLNDTLSTSVPDEPMMAAFLALLIVLLITRRRLIPAWALRHPLTLIIAAQFVWTLVTVVFSTQPLFAVKYVLAKCWFLASFFVMPWLVFREKRDFRNAFWLVIIPLLLTMAVIFVRHAMFGFYFRQIENAIANIYYNHVDYSTVMSMVFPVVCVAWPLSHRWPLWWRVALAGTILFFLPAIYLTYARAAMLAVVFAAGIALAIRLRLVQWVMPVFYGVVLLGVLSLGRNNTFMKYRPNFNETYMHTEFIDHLVATFKGQDMSSMERVYRWIAAVRMSKDRPLTGYGPNSFYENYKPYAVHRFRTYVSRNPERSTTHNYFLLMLVEQGWPAMILYALLVQVAFVRAQRAYHRFKGDRFYRAATLGVAMMFAAAFINNFFSELIETHKVGALFYLSLSLLVVLEWKSRQTVTDSRVV